MVSILLLISNSFSPFSTSPNSILADFNNAILSGWFWCSFLFPIPLVPSPELFSVFLLISTILRSGYFRFLLISNSTSPFTWTIFSILANFNNVVILMVSILLLISSCIAWSCSGSFWVFLLSPNLLIDFFRLSCETCPHFFLFFFFCGMGRSFLFCWFPECFTFFCGFA